MNLSRHIRVTRKELDSWIQYLLDSGYKMQAYVEEHSIIHSALNADGSLNPDYGVIEIRDKSTNRWSRWITIRIPKIG